MDAGRARPDRTGGRARVASRRPDGTFRPYVTIWAVRSGDELYIRSAHGWDNPWFQRALRSGEGRIQAGGVERDVVFEETSGELTPALHAAYHAKYDRNGPSIVGTVVRPRRPGDPSAGAR